MADNARTGSVRSMTGFGSASVTASGLSICAEISSVNRRQFDCSVTLPREFAVLESRVVECVHRVIRRGYVKVNLRIRQPDDQTLRPAARLDLDMARSQIEALRRAGAQLGLPDTLNLSDLAALPNVLVFDAGAMDPNAIWPGVENATVRALRALDKMRATEGARLMRDIHRRCERLGRMVSAIARRAPGLALRYRQNLLARLRSADLPLDVADPAILREVVLFADRSQVSEEITRLESHLAQFETLSTANAPRGRSLDFLCQECLREINTLGSKAGDVVVTRHVIRFKSELEAIREQVQNIE